MTALFRRRPSPATCIAVAALVVASASVTYAAIPAADGTIRGCYSNDRGALRVVEEGAACAVGETPLTWSQTGPHGATGAPGATGAAGPQGPAGAAGPAGIVKAYTSKKDKFSVSAVMLSAPKAAVTSMSVPPGVYVVLAKANFTSVDKHAGGHRLTCTLAAGASFDSTVVAQRPLAPSDSNLSGSIGLTLVTRFAPGGRGAPRIRMRCTKFNLATPSDSPAQSVDLFSIRIIAIPVVGETTG